MFEVGFTEIVLIFGIALLVLGPERLPKLAADVGRWAGRARAMARTLRTQLEQEVQQIDPLASTNTSRPAGSTTSPPASSSAASTPAAETPAPAADTLAPVEETPALVAPSTYRAESEAPAVTPVSNEPDPDHLEPSMPRQDVR